MKTNTYLGKVKFYFTGFIALWMLFIVFMTKDHVVDRQLAAATRQAKYLNYKAQFSQDHEGVSFSGAAAALLGVFKSPQNVAIADSRAMGVPVLVYHGIVDTPDRFSLTPDAFKEQMFALKRAGYETVTVEDFIKFAKGEKTLPDRSFLLTFDDGRRDSFEQADPILKTLGWSAVMFVATGQSYKDISGNGYYLNEEQIRQMASSGRWEIQSHAVQPIGGFVPIDAQGETGNFLSNYMWLAGENRLETEEEYRARVFQELALSKSSTEALFGKPVKAFAYPFSDYGNQTINAEGVADSAVRNAVESNYEAAFRQTWNNDNYFTWNFMDEDMYRLRRIETPTDWSGEKLVSHLENSRTKDLPYSDTLLSDHGWKNPWGTISFGEEDGLTLSPGATSNGAFAFLDGSRAWGNYEYEMEAERGRKEFLTLYARYQSNDNYVTCTFGDESVRLEERVEGVTRTRVETRTDISNDLASYGIRAEGDSVSCLENGRVVASASGVSRKIATGGIGIRVWSDGAQDASLTAKNLSVRPLESAPEILESPAVDSQ